MTGETPLAPGGKHQTTGLFDDSEPYLGVVAGLVPATSSQSTEQSRASRIAVVEQARPRAPKSSAAMIKAIQWAALRRCFRNWKNSTPSRIRRRITSGLRSISAAIDAILGARK